jgi:hypothetical protein
MFAMTIFYIAPPEVLTRYTDNSLNRAALFTKILTPFVARPMPLVE